MSKYESGTIYKRTKVVSTIYKPIIEGNEWFAETYDKQTYSNERDDYTKSSMQVFKELLRISIIKAKDIEESRLRNLRAFLLKQEAGNESYNRLVNSWSNKELIYYGYQYNRLSVQQFNTLLLEKTGVTVGISGMEISVYINGTFQNKLGFKDNEQMDFFKKGANEFGELTPNAKGILFEQFVSGLKYKATRENSQEDVIAKRILTDSIGSDKGVVDLLYTGNIAYLSDGKVMTQGKMELPPVDIKFSTRQDGLLSIFKGISGLSAIIKMNGNYPAGFEKVPKFKEGFERYLRKQISNSLIMEADNQASGQGSQILRKQLNEDLSNPSSSFSKILTIVLALTKIVNNIENAVNQTKNSNEFPVFVQNPGLINSDNNGIIGDILFSSDILNSIYMNLFNGESVIKSETDYGLRKSTKIEVSSRAYTASSDSYRKSIISSGADIPVLKDQRKLAEERHKKATDRILGNIKFSLIYGKKGG